MRTNAHDFLIFIKSKPVLTKNIRMYNNSANVSAVWPEYFLVMVWTIFSIQKRANNNWICCNCKSYTENVYHFFLFKWQEKMEPILPASLKKLVSSAFLISTSDSCLIFIGTMIFLLVHLLVSECLDMFHSN